MPKAAVVAAVQALLARPAVVCLSPGLLAEKISKAQDRKDLQIIADFDMTMTSFMVAGKRGKSSHRLVEDSPFFSASYREKSKALFEHYYPIEISMAVPQDEKIKAMVEWWTKAHDLMIAEGLNQSQLSEVAKGDSIALRERAPELIRTAHSLNVPMHIFSAGLYDVIHAYINHLGLGSFGVHVVSNMMDFDPATGALVGFKGSIIHTFNKNGTALRGSPGWPSIENRHSVLLLGDSQSDIHMAKGIPADNIISVGFLNDRVDERLQAFSETFDIVLLNDASMDLPLEILKLCSGSAS